MTVSDYRVGDRIVTVKVRDTLPVGATGTIYQVYKGELGVSVILDGPWRRSHGHHWSLTLREIAPEIDLNIPLLGDDDEDCI